MPPHNPVSQKGAKYTTVPVNVVPNHNAMKGDVCVFVSGYPADGGEDVFVERVSNPKHKNRRLCVLVQDAVSGQEAKAITMGTVLEVALTLTRPLEFDEPLVVTEAGTLTNDAQPGDRMVGYSRCSIPNPTTKVRTLGKVLFDGLAGFGAYQ